MLARDGYGCILYVLVADHRCAGGVTLDHVPCRGRNAMGKRANGDRYHLAVVCREANVEGDVSALRGVEQDHIEGKEGPHHHDDDGATIPGPAPEPCEDEACPVGFIHEAHEEASQ